jgi:hypothetical protein
MFVWPEENERGPVAVEMHQLMVEHLEGLVAAGVIDPDLLVADDQDARQAYREIQDRWLNEPLPDGRIPAFAVTDEQDDEMFAAHDAEQAFALSELRRVVGELPERAMPAEELRVAIAMLRERLAGGGYPYDVLLACAGLEADKLPEGDEELWLSLGAGLVQPIDDLPDDDDIDAFADFDAAIGRGDSSMAHLCAVETVDWLGIVTALARKGPGTFAMPMELARFLEESEDVDVTYEDPDDLQAEAVMLHDVVFLWEMIGALDEHQRLTALGWWGLPKALERAWLPRD